MSAPENSPSQRSRRQRPQRSRGKKKPEGLNAVQALKRAEPTAERVKGPAEEPLTRDEVRHLKAAFRFLREQRNTLKLRVNASEDLLLNEKREPTHRGVCQHLLAKVERAKVLGASERLPPKQATELLAGVIRFAPELPYVMRFLECVKASAGQEQAAAALTHALSKIDFEEASDAQIRHILALIVDIFPERQQPAFLLSFLKTKAFRTAFDRSSEGLPETLAKMLLPLREVYDLLHERDRQRRGGKQKRRTLDVKLLSEGALLLLRVDERSLLEFDAPVRRRLFHLLGDSAPQGELPRAALLSLFQSLSFRDVSERQGALLSLVRLFLRANMEKDARKLLRDDIEARKKRQARPDKGDKSQKGAQVAEAPSESARLLSLLQEPRIGSIAIEPPRGGRSQESKESRLPQPGRFYHGVELSTLQPVRILFSEGEGREAFIRSAHLWQDALIPLVELPCGRQLDDACERPYVVLRRFESSLGRALKGASEDRVRQLVFDLCRIASAMNAAGLGLPDGALRRYSVDGAGQLWLSDLSSVEKVSPGEESSWLSESLKEIGNAALSWLSEEEFSELAKTPLSPLHAARRLQLLS